MFFFVFLPTKVGSARSALASTVCSGAETLRRLGRGEEFDRERREHFEAALGEVEAPGRSPARKTQSKKT